MSRDSPGPGPQNILQEEALGTQVDYRKGMSGKIMDNACCDQHGVIEDRSEACTARAEVRAVPAPDRVGEREGDGSG